MVTRLLRRSFLPVISFFAASAAALALYVRMPVEAAFVLGFVLAAIATLLSGLPGRRHLAPALALAAIGLIAGSLASNRSNAVPLLPPIASAENSVTIRGRALSDSGETPSGLYRAPVEVEWIGAGERTDPHITGGHVIEAGQSWRGRGMLLFRSARTPAAEDSFGASGPTLLWGDRFRATVRLWCPKGGRECLLIGEELLLAAAPHRGPGGYPEGRTGGGPLSLVATLRRPLRRAIGSALAMLPGDLRPLTGALVLGDRSYLRADSVDAFRRGGLSHVLALSGMHLGIVAGSVLLVVRRLFSERAAIIAALAVAWGYLLLVGPGASLLRAAAMFSFWALGRMLYRRPEPLTVLGLTFLLFVFLLPDRTGEVGFWFSFLALAGLLLFGPPLTRCLEGWIPPLLAAPLGVSTAAFLATAPLSLALFGFAAPVGIFASVVIAPLVVVVLWSGIILLSGAALGYLLLPVYWITGRLQSGLLSAVETAAGAPVVTADPAISGSWPLGIIPLVIVAVVLCLQLGREARIRAALDREPILV